MYRRKKRKAQARDWEEKEHPPLKEEEERRGVSVE